MRLHGSPRSPFVRTVTVAAHELGCALSCADFRFPSLRWREAFAARPSMRATAAADD